MKKPTPTVPTMTALATYRPKGGMRVGAKVRVRSVDTVFELQRAEGRTPDGITLVAAAGGMNRVFRRQIAPDQRVLDKLGRIKRHAFEQAHDDPAPGGPCWYCLRPRDAKVHAIGRRR